MIYITTKSPECAWDPFMDWLREHGIDPHWCYQVEIPEGEDPQCVAYLYASDARGNRYVDRRTGSPAKLPPKPFLARRPAPRRFR